MGLVVNMNVLLSDNGADHLHITSKVKNSAAEMHDVLTLGIVLSWNMATSARHEEAAHYHLYAYQEGTDPPTASIWKRVRHSVLTNCCLSDLTLCD